MLGALIGLLLGAGSPHHACTSAVAATPFPETYVVECVNQDPTDLNFGLTDPNGAWNGVGYGGEVTIYYGEHEMFGASWRVELQRTIEHEAHHAHCMNNGGWVDHSGPDNTPLCTERD